MSEAKLDSAFLTHQSALKAFFLRHLRCPDTAADLLHDCFVRLAQQPAHVVDNARAFLFACARNLLIDHLRKQQYRQHPALDSAAGMDALPAAVSPPLENAVIAREHLQRLQQAIDGLSPRCREVFLLARLHGLTYAAIGKRLGISEKTAFAHMARALKLLAAQLRDFA